MTPKGVFSLAFTQMWESFSFFGMRALLVLYLVSQAGYSYQDAVILYTLYIASVKIFGVAGGYAVDRFLGYKRAVLIGGTLIMAGHLLLTFSSERSLFFLSLGSIVCGSALFRVSVQTLLGLFYDKGYGGREKGFTLLYVGMNLGGLLAAVLCGIVAKTYGWHAGFGLAALGMVAGMAFFLSKLRQFKWVEETQKAPLAYILPLCLLGVLGLATLLHYFKVVQAGTLLLGIISLVLIFLSLGKKMGKSVLALGASFLLLIAFFTAEELWGSLLMVFSENHVQRTVFGFEIPSAAIAALNPLTIILLGPFMMKREMRMEIKCALAFLMLALAFFVLYMATLVESPSILYLVVGLSSIAMGELFLAPTVMSFVSQSAPAGSSGLMMGTSTLALSMGSLFSGEVAKIPFSPGQTFLIIGSSALGIFMLLAWIAKISSVRAR